MKDRIFIIWSGGNDIAYKVKRILEDQYNYICYVGGNDDNSSTFASVGDTVIQQMKTCNQAIVLFQNRDDGAVSNNLFFELGFALAKYSTKKIHCVYRKGESIILPSDFDNSFVECIEALDNDEYASKVVTYFLKRQKLSIEENKMHLITNRYLMHDMIQAHFSIAGSRCSDYELAQYVLFYMQAAVMFQDEQAVLDELKSFKRNYNNQFSTELMEAVTLSISFLEVQVALENENEVVYLPDAAYRRYYSTCHDMLDEIADDESGTFNEWAKVFLSENLAYATTLYATNPKLDDSMKNRLFGMALNYGERCLDFLNSLEQVAPCIENNDHIGLVSLFKGYIYRHLFTAASALGDDKATEWLKASLGERKKLLRNFDEYSIDTQIYNTFRMEYYLNLMEYIAFCGRETIDDFEYIMYLNEVDSFIKECSEHDSLNVYIKRISGFRNQF